MDGKTIYGRIWRLSGVFRPLSEEEVAKSSLYIKYIEINEYAYSYIVSKKIFYMQALKARTIQNAAPSIAHTVKKATA